MKKILFIALFLAAHVPLFAQAVTTTAGRIQGATGTLSGSCAPDRSFRVDGANTIKVCISGSWVTIATGGSVGDFSSNTSSSVDGEIVLFSGTGGKTGKRATGTGAAWINSGVLGTITWTSPLSFSAGTASIANAAADGLTKGAASFAAADFDATSGNIALDYTNGQAASGTTKGFLTSADWTTFNSKAPATSGSTLLFGNGIGGFTGATGSSVSGANVILGGTLTVTSTVNSASGPLILDTTNGVSAPSGIKVGTNKIGIGWAAGSNTIGIAPEGKFGFTSSANDGTGSPDTALCRNAAAVFEFNRGTCGSNIGLKITATASGVNNLNVASAATAGHPTITAEGSDTNININLVPKGSGVGQVNGSTIVTSDNTITKTNLTLDAEGTGNVLTIPLKYWFPAAGCNNATAATMFDLPTTTPAVAACVTGTNTQKGVLDFADTTGGFSAQNHLLLPADFTGNIDARIIWLTTATTGNAKWSLSTICTAVDATETDDPAFNTASTVTTAAPGIANRLQTSSITTVTATGCAAGELLHFKIFRDGADASDTIAATARLVGIELTIRGAK